jgi:hypothetical protein
MRPIFLLSAWVPVVAAASLFFWASGMGWQAAALAAAPSACIVAGAVRSMWLPDVRGPQIIAVGALLGMILSPPALFVSVAFCLAMFAVCAAAFIASGWLQIRMQPQIEGVHGLAPSPIFAARVALDNLIMGLISLTTSTPLRAELESAADEVDAAYALFTQRGWIGRPAAYHLDPPVPDTVQLVPIVHKRFALESLSFESGYDPDRAIPAAERWLAYEQNRIARAHLLRRPGEGRWVVCIHGAGMGSDLGMDFNAFRVADWHERHGYNVALFTLPVHGPRSPTKTSGVAFFGTSPMDFVHAETQAIWDLRRLIRWIRAQDATEVGIVGISLGGYTSALLASIESDLAFVLACVPPTDMVALDKVLTSGLDRRRRAAAGVEPDKEHALYSVVAPLADPAKVPFARRFIYAASGDQFAPIEQALALWHHWDRPRIHWCKGGHVSAIFLQRQLGPFMQEIVPTARQ